MREKHGRSNRRARSAKADFDPCCFASSIPKSLLESGLKPLASNLGLHDPSSANPNPNLSEDNGWGYCTEEQLEEVLLKNLDFLYKEAIAKLVSLGYDEDIALKAILRDGHCYGGMDVLTNILHNTLAYLNSDSESNCERLDDSELVFTELRQLEEYSLAGMICLLQKIRPNLSKGDAMWCLLVSDLHVGRASTIEIPVATSSADGNTSVQSNASNCVENGVGVAAPALCRFHGGWGFGSGTGPDFAVNGFFSYSAEMALQKDIDCPKRFNLSPCMKSLLKRNVAMFAAGFRANSKQMQAHFQPQPLSCIGVASGGNSPSAVPGGEVLVEKGEEPHNLKAEDGVSSVLSKKFSDLNLDGNPEVAGGDQRDEMIASLLHQIRDLEEKVKERKEWAHEKAMQAARKLSSDLTELKLLRMEREETQRLKKGKLNLEDSTMKRLTEMENAMKKASDQVEKANRAVRRLETENAEIRAEMEASKLSASESVASRLEAAKREKKCLKKLLAWEKQKAKLQDEIADEKEKIKELKRCLAMVEQAQKETEEKWKESVKAREQAAEELEAERLAKEASDANNKRKIESLRLKIEIDFQRQKDDLQRLEQELSRLQASADLAEQQLNGAPASKPQKTKPTGETIAKLLQDLEVSSEKGAKCDRDCVICMKEEVSVVFLPCAHQVMCAGCSDTYGKKGKAKCPCCRVPIEQRIRVFGASSS